MSAGPTHTDDDRTPVEQVSYRLGCVSFLNAVPLIDGIEQLGQMTEGADLQVHFDVPSRLLADLEADRVDAALCPVIDLQKSELPLQVVPAGGIGCYGKTLTVRIFSRVPIEKIESIACDTDSHTSVVLMQVLLSECFGLRPKVMDYAASAKDKPTLDTILLIGDKVVTHPPDESVYRYQLDLGECWRQLTSLPFVFAVWMAKQESDLGDLPGRLDKIRYVNTTDKDRLSRIVREHAPKHGWPLDLANQYLGGWLCYDIGAEQLQAMELFFAKAHELGLIDQHRPIQAYEYSPAD